MNVKKFGGKTLKAGNRFLKTVGAAGTLARKSGYALETAGKVVSLAGAVTAQPEIVAAGAGMMASGDVMQIGGIAARHTATGIQKGDPGKVASGVKRGIGVFA